ncbi:MAG: molecular chaperone GroEL, partial [Bacteroidota bacterium]
NKAKIGLKVCNIIPPQFGYKRHQLMEDIALSTGAKFFSEKTGDNLALCTVDDLGQADKAVVSRFNTIIFGAKGEMDERVNELLEQYGQERLQQEKDFLKERMANLGGGVAVIKVGANSDIEQKEKKDRVDDAVCAVRAALEEGVLPGGGVALKDIAKMVCLNPTDVAWNILSKSLYAPMGKILENAGMEYNFENPTLQNEGIGVNVINGAFCDMMNVGIIDPAKVTKLALTNAISVATTLLSTNTVITNVRQM